MRSVYSRFQNQTRRQRKRKIQVNFTNTVAELFKQTINKIN